MTQTINRRIDIRDETLQYIFTSGDCWILAAELHSLTGLPLVAFTCGNDPSDWNHMAVQVAEDTFLDIEGLHSVDDFINDYWCNKNDECEQVARIIDVPRWHHLVSLTDPPRWCVERGEDFLCKNTDGDSFTVAEIAEDVFAAYVTNAR